MNLKYRIILVIVVLLLGLSLVTSVLNYFKSLEQTKKQLVEVSLPLSITNIYSEVQKNIIEPNLISSMMANDTFVKDWLVNNEKNNTKIEKYLDTVKNKYNLLNTFLVSDATKNYYTADGYVETIKKEEKKDSWYFNFKRNQLKNELNLDYNVNIDDSIVMFINYKIFDNNYNFLGATGVAVRTSYINNMLKSFRTNYNFNVFFVDPNGKIVLSESNRDNPTHLNDSLELKQISKEIFNSSKKVEYKKNNEKYILSSEYIKELNLYLVVEAKIDSFMVEVRKTFYINLIFSIFITFIVIYIIVAMIKKYNKKLEYLANNDPLTDLPNRRKFTENFENTLFIFKRNSINQSIIFFDLDNFKNLNDTYGHLTGDKVLVRIGEILKENIRKSDYISRWGGEEFSILCNSVDVNKAKIVAQKLRVTFEEDIKLKELVPTGLTASFGVTEFRINDDYDSIVTRVDSALYKAKKDGKNTVVVK